MLIRVVSIFTLLTFLITTSGCSTVFRRTADEAAQRTGGKIIAVGLKGTHPYDIELNDLSEIRVTKVRAAASGGSIADTLPAEKYKDEAGKWVAMQITSVLLESGKEVALNDRKCYYDAGRDVIRVDGDEIVFDTLGGHLYTDAGQIRGKTTAGESVDIMVDSVAYVRQKEGDAGKTLLLVVGITGAVVGVGLLILMAGFSQMD